MISRLAGNRVSENRPYLVVTDIIITHTRISRKDHARALLLSTRVLPASWCDPRQLCPNKLNENIV